MTKHVIELTKAPYRISDKLLGLMYYRRGCETGCGGDCCGGGVPVGLEQIQEIVRRADDIKPYMAKSNRERRWFRGLDGFNVDGRLPNDTVAVALHGYPQPAHFESSEDEPCVFLNEKGLCSLHVYGTENEPHPWAVKPMLCWLYPLVFWNGVLSLVTTSMLEVPRPVRGKCVISTQTPIPGYRLFEPEIHYLLGDAGWSELVEIAESRKE